LSYRKAMNRLCWLLEQPDETAQSVQSMVKRLIACLRYIEHPHMNALNETRWFVLSRALMGCLRSASLERFNQIDSNAFEDDLVEMVLGQMRLVPMTS